MELDKAKQKELKRKNREAFGYGDGEDMSDDDSDGGKAAKNNKKKLEGSQTKYS